MIFPGSGRWLADRVASGLTRRPCEDLEDPGGVGCLVPMPGDQRPDPSSRVAASPSSSAIRIRGMHVTGDGAASYALRK